MWEKAGQNGLLGVNVNEEHGGIGGDVLSTAITWEEQYVFVEIHESLIENGKKIYEKFIIIIYIYALSIKIPMKLQIYTNTCISMKQFFFLFFKVLKKNAIQNASVVEIFGSIQ